MTAAHSNAMDMKRRMFARSDRNPLDSFPNAYTVSIVDPITPIWVADRIPSSSSGFLTTEKLMRAT